MKFNLIGCIALVLWASSIPFAKRCSEDVGPLTVTALQYLVGGLLGLTSNLVLGKLRRSEIQFLKYPQFYFRASLFALYAALLYFAIGAVERDKLPVVTLLNYLWPTVTMVLSVLILRQAFNPILLVLGSVVVISGLAVEILGQDTFKLLLQPHSGLSAAAFIAAALAAVAWGFYTVLNRLWGTRAGGVVALPFVMLLSSVILFLLRFLFGEESSFPPDVFVPLAYMLVMPYLANVCWDLGTRRGSITFLSLLADGLPWASLTIASIYLGIAIESKTWISAVLIVCGALISRLSLLVSKNAKSRQI